MDKEKPILWYEDRIKGLNLGVYLNSLSAIKSTKYFILSKGENSLLIVEFENYSYVNSFIKILEDKNLQYTGRELQNCNNGMILGFRKAKIENEGWNDLSNNSSPNFS